MTDPEVAAAPLPDPWYALPADWRPRVERELRRELGPGHPLCGADAIAVARCEACDDVVFRIDGEPPRYVRVHLTWRQATEPPPWPAWCDLELPLSASLAEWVH